MSLANPECACFCSCCCCGFGVQAPYDSDDINLAYYDPSDAEPRWWNRRYECTCKKRWPHVGFEAFDVESAFTRLQAVINMRAADLGKPIDNTKWAVLLDLLKELG